MSKLRSSLYYWHNIARLQSNVKWTLRWAAKSRNGLNGIVAMCWYKKWATQLGFGAHASESRLSIACLLYSNDVPLKMLLFHWLARLFWTVIHCRRCVWKSFVERLASMTYQQVLVFPSAQTTPVHVEGCFVNKSVTKNPVIAINFATKVVNVKSKNFDIAEPTDAQQLRTMYRWCIDACPNLQLLLGQPVKREY